MSDEIKQVLESFIGQEQQILNRHSLAQSQRNDPTAHLKGEAFNLLAREALGSRGSRIVRSFIEISDRQTRSSLVANSETEHRRILNQVRSFLGTVSEGRKNLIESNSEKLLSRLERAQTGARVDTRIRHTIKLLTTLKSKRLVYNKELPTIPQIDVIIPPGNPFTGRMELRKILGTAAGYVKICDSYVSIKTLDILNSIPIGTPIKLLTMNTGGSKRAPAFLRACKDFKVERPDFEVRKGERLHDRFIIMENGGWSVGSSLNAFGNKVSVLTPLQKKGKRELEHIFDDLWKKSRVLIPYSR